MNENVNKLAELICRQLGLQLPRIEYTASLMTATTLAAVDPVRRVLQVNSAISADADLYFSVVHELRHLWQWETQPEMFAEYKGPGELPVVEYNMQPAELDANAYAQLVMAELFGVKPLFNGLPEAVKAAIADRAEEIIRSLQK